LTFIVASIAGGRGTVALDPMGTSCGIDCVAYDRDQTVTITATAASPSLFSAWSGDCAAETDATCTLVMSENRAAVAHFRPNMNLMFVTSQTIQPSTIGPTLAGADAFCTARAKAGALGGSIWKAWLSTSATTTNINAADHVSLSARGWIRIDGRPFATSVADLLAGKVLYPPRLTELNTDRGQTLAVASGTRADGSTDSGLNCMDWTSATGSLNAGDVDSTTSAWTYAQLLGGDSCGGSYPIYCFESDDGMEAVPAPKIPVGGRRAFLSSDRWIPGGGVDAADMLCQREATMALLDDPNSYRALLSTTVVATDSSRFDLAGEPWFRLDGAQIVATAADVAAPAGDKLLTPINVDSMGRYNVNLEVWTGSGNAPGVTTNTSNCDCWISGTPDVSGWFGIAATTRSDSMKSLFWASSTQPCNTASRVYCLQR